MFCEMFYLLRCFTLNELFAKGKLSTFAEVLATITHLNKYWRVWALASAIPRHSLTGLDNILKLFHCYQYTVQK